MNDEFRNRLRLQLVEAAEREERRGSVVRQVADVRQGMPRLSTGRLAAALLVVAILALAIYELTALRPEPAAPIEPKVVVRFAPAASLGDLASGFGSVWADDTARGQLLRIDPRSRRVTARIGARGSAAIAVGGDSIWALEGTDTGFDLAGPLLRIDPRTNRVTARIPLRTPAGARFRAWEVAASDDVVWIVGPRGALRIDPASNRVTKAIQVESRYEVQDGALVGNELWMLVGDGRLLRFDALTGAREAQLRAAASGDLLSVENVLLMLSGTDVTRIDPHTGRALWRRPVERTRSEHATLARDLVWIPGPGDELRAIDPLTGRVVSATHLHEFGASDIDAVGSELWVSTVGGRIVVVRP